jgi:sigma-B regulation protein RsbU (phosphoserine phosphatase)
VQLRNSAIAISGLITVLVILIALNLAKSISQPIIDLTQVTRSIVSGEFNWEAPIDTNDEIGRLARSFNAMLNRLHHSFMDLEAINQELEDRVEERTRSLQWANLEIQMLNEKLQEENLRMSSELAITQRLQQLILPRDHELLKISNLDIAGFMQPATEVGGDYYDVIQNNGSIRIGVGDITGHGLESGILMIMLQTAIRTLTHSQEKNPVRFMNILNQVIYENVQRMNTDKSLSLLLLEYSNNRINLSGQHEEAIIAHPDGTVECIDTIDLGFPLGLEADISQFVNQYSIDLSRGDVVVLYTDGITEAENSEHQFYSKERLCQVIQRHIHLTAREIREEIIADLKAHIGSQTIFDDITLVVLKRK